MSTMHPPSMSEEKHPDIEAFGHNSTSRGFDYRGESSNSGFNYRTEEDLDIKKPRSFTRYNDGEEPQGKLSEYDIEMNHLPPDQRPSQGELLALVDPEIDDHTEAAEALRANANVKVPKVGKVMRGVGAQSVRKLAKRVTLRGQSGNKRGKPPRIPPGFMAAGAQSGGDGVIFSVNEEGEFADGGHGHDQESFESASAGHQHDHDISERYDLSRPSTNQEDKKHAPKRVRIKDEGSTASPVHDGDYSKNKYRHSSLDDAKDIPHEVATATMEAGRKRKLLC